MVIIKPERRTSLTPSVATLPRYEAFPNPSESSLSILSSDYDTRSQRSGSNNESAGSTTTAPTSVHSLSNQRSTSTLSTIRSPSSPHRPAPPIPIPVLPPPPPLPPPQHPPLNHTRPLSCTFANWSDSTASTSGSLQLLGPDSIPLYHISVRLNLHPFAPLSYVTKVRRGGEGGVPVGGFELAINQKNQGSVTLGDISTRLSNVLFRIKNSKINYGWQCGDIKLRWDLCTDADDAPFCACYDLTPPHRNTQLASLQPPSPSSSPPLPPAVLTVFPAARERRGEGLQLLDHIVISALVIERRRTLERMQEVEPRVRVLDGEGRRGEREGCAITGSGGREGREGRGARSGGQRGGRVEFGRVRRD